MISWSFFISGRNFVQSGRFGAEKSGMISDSNPSITDVDFQVDLLHLLQGCSPREVGCQNPVCGLADQIENIAAIATAAKLRRAS